MLEEKGKYSPQVIYLIIGSQMLTTENLDLLFSEKIISNLHVDVIIRVLYKCENFLKAQHIENIYKHFNFNENVLKILFATQKYSDFLLETHPENVVLKEYYKKLQVEKTYLNWKLKLFPVSHLAWYASLSFIIISLFLIILLFIFINRHQLNTDLRNSVITLSISLLIITFMPFMKYFSKRYRQYYINQIIKN
jgi:hypothetical protein